MKSLNLLFIFCLLFSACFKSSEKKQKKESESPLFEKQEASHTGIEFENNITEHLNNFFLVYNYAYNGAGVAAGDINNDGLIDLFFTGNQVSNRLYLNQGNFKFKDITETAGVTTRDGWSNGVVMADVNGDNFLDIYVCRGGWKGTTKERSNLLYINNGDNTFSEQSAVFQLNDPGFSMMASFFDYDNDNDLDMYLVNRPQKFNLSHQAIAAGKAEQNPLFTHKLYENKNGKFIDISAQSGITNTFSYGLGIVTSDLNKDGYTDVYVANDYFESDYFFKNNGNKTFTEEIKKISNHVAFYGMGVDVADFNNDGYEDLVELDMTPEDHERSKVNMASMNVEGYERILQQGNHNQYMHNMLQINNGNGFFSEISQYAGIAKTDWSWSCLGSDFDNDGLRDLFISNGFRRDIFDKDASTAFANYVKSDLKKSRSKVENMKHIVSLFKENKIPNYIYKNEGDLKFSMQTQAWGLEEPSFSNGATVADLDNDGDLDLIVNNINAPAFIYKNKAEELNNNFIDIKLKGPSLNSNGLGAKITVFYDNQKQFHELKTVRGYLSSVSSKTHFGLGKSSLIDSVTVQWNDGKKSLITNATVNKTLFVEYEKAKSIKQNHTIKSKLFEDITNQAFKTEINYKENQYNDFENQVLLPHKISTEGPCLAVNDVNNDGLEDFYLGGASGFSARLFIQNNDKTFTESKVKAFQNDSQSEDTAALFLDVNGDGFQDLYVSSGGNQFESNHIKNRDRLYYNNGLGDFKIANNFPEVTGNKSCIVPLDYDGDGDLDLFIGGRIVTNQYLQAPKSYILTNENGVYKDNTKKIAQSLEYFGMITDAVWTNIDSDPEKELVVVGEWLPVSVFKFNGNNFENTNHEDLKHTSGWWNCVKAQDLDMDGDNDLILGNLGLNYKFKASPKNPFYVYASDFDKNGTNDVFLAKNYKDRIVPIRGKECSSQQMPGLTKKFKTYTAFAKADIGTILDTNENTKKHQAECFESIIAFNNGNGFELKKLPYQAQFSTLQDAIIDDFNNDNKPDVFIAGNHFDVEIETTRADASIGLLLTNSKEGHRFSPEPYRNSGIFLPQNVKELKSITIGNTHSKTKEKGILVGINNGPLKLLKGKF